MLAVLLFTLLLPLALCEVPEAVEVDPQLEERNFAAESCLGGCCSAGTKCEGMGGTCHPTNFRCSLPLNQEGFCHSKTCRCCMGCSQGGSCSMVRGTCRRDCKCQPGEYGDQENTCPEKPCTCCRPCPQTRECASGGSDPGRCMGDVSFYLEEYETVYPSMLNCGKDCHCVHKCREDDICKKSGGYCVRHGVSCKRGYEMLKNCGCENLKTCGCCVPEGKAVEANRMCNM